MQYGRISHHSKLPLAQLAQLAQLALQLAAPLKDSGVSASSKDGRQKSSKKVKPKQLSHPLVAGCSISSKLGLL